jgi:hypothetical protein
VKSSFDIDPSSWQKHKLQKERGLVPAKQNKFEKMMKKKSRTDKKSTDRSPNIMLQLAPDVSLEMSKNKDKVKLQIYDGEKKINIPPNIWRILHLSSEAISLLPSFIEGSGGVTGYYQTYYYRNSSQENTTETENSRVQQQDIKSRVQTESVYDSNVMDRESSVTLT